jgi:predicted TIM-barrel fold metal-dependent hydrolase
MDKVGIDKKVISVVDWGLGLGEPASSIRKIHHEILEICSRFPDRFTCFAGVDPRRDEAPALVEWAFDEMGALGLKLHPTTGWALSDESALHIVSLAADRRLPVLVHVGKTLEVLSDFQSQPEALIQLARAFPQTSFIAGHSGFDRWRSFTEPSDLPANLCFDISGWQELDAADPQQTRNEMAELVGAFPGRVWFGTDSPFYSYNLPAAESKWLATIHEAIPSSTVDTVLSCPLFSHASGEEQ